MRKVSRIFELISEVPSVSIVGLDKNTGKTVVLNHLIGLLAAKSIRAGITSVGLEGEKIDQVFLTEKPEIYLRSGTLFATSERDFAAREFPATVLDLREFRSPLGRTVIAQARADGKIVISGPSIIDYLLETVRLLKDLGAEKIIVDGAVSRLSPGSPFVSDALILSTGASVASSVDEIVRRTVHAVRLISLGGVESDIAQRLEPLTNGVWLLQDGCRKLAGSGLLLQVKPDEIRSGVVYINGSLTSATLRRLAVADVTVVARDFTKIFADSDSLSYFSRAGGELKVLYPARLLAVTVNPTSPTGYHLRSEAMIEALEKELRVPVFDVLREGVS